jgi:hypothetical protein
MLVLFRIKKKRKHQTPTSNINIKPEARSQLVFCASSLLLLFVVGSLNYRNTIAPLKTKSEEHEPQIKVACWTSLLDRAASTLRHRHSASNKHVHTANRQ